jgi:hypothetical protein
LNFGVTGVNLMAEILTSRITEQCNTINNRECDERLQGYVFPDVEETYSMLID